MTQSVVSTPNGPLVIDSAHVPLASIVSGGLMVDSLAPRTASASITFAAMTVTAADAAIDSVAASITLAPLTVAATVTTVLRASEATTLAPLTVTATAGVVNNAQAAITFAPLTTSAGSLAPHEITHIALDNECAIARAPFVCPTNDQVIDAALSLLPKGRAWQTHEGGPRDRDGRPSTLLRFWKSVADVLSFTNQRWCDLRLEFWCATQTETRDLWMAEYGLPDACDPFPDLCTKVRAIGGTRCEYYAEVAARAGWSITCEPVVTGCTTRAGSGGALAGIAIPGHETHAGLKITVDLNNSPAWTGGPRTLPLAGKFLAGRTLTCGPDLTALQCIMERIVHAEIEITYEDF
jgi:hypothetical protein